MSGFVPPPNTDDKNLAYEIHPLNDIFFDEWNKWWGKHALLDNSSVRDFEKSIVVTAESASPGRWVTALLLEKDFTH